MPLKIVDWGDISNDTYVKDKDKIDTFFKKRSASEQNLSVISLTKLNQSLAKHPKINTCPFFF